MIRLSPVYVQAELAYRASLRRPDVRETTGQRRRRRTLRRHRGVLAATATVAPEVGARAPQGTAQQGPAPSVAAQPAAAPRPLETATGPTTGAIVEIGSRQQPHAAA